MNPFWLDRPTFVTGATGLVGSHVVSQLIGQGADIVCLVRDEIPHSLFFQSGLHRQVRSIRGDICDQALLERVLGEYEIDTVFHLAAQAIVGVANRNAVSTFQSNIAGTWSLLEACRRSPKVHQIVMASSDKAYGQARQLPYCEDTPLAATHPYDVSKACADLIAQSYATTFQLPVVITRCGNFFGPGDLQWNRIVPGTIRSILRNHEPVIRSDGKLIRDYFYVEDGAAAYLLLAEQLAADSCLRGEAYNFSYEQPLSVLELVEKICSLMGVPFAPRILNEPCYEIREQYLSAKKACNQLGWSARYSLDQALLKTVQWYRGFFGQSALRDRDEPSSPHLFPFLTTDSHFQAEHG